MIIEELLDQTYAICSGQEKTPFWVAWRSAVESFIDGNVDKAHQLVGEVLSYPRLYTGLVWDKPGENGLYYELVQNVLTQHWLGFEVLLKERESGYEALTAEQRTQARFAQTSLR